MLKSFATLPAVWQAQLCQDTLNFMRNHQFEAPFIAFYRKEYVEPELNIHDLFKIYHWDEKVTYSDTVCQCFRSSFCFQLKKC